MNTQLLDQAKKTYAKAKSFDTQKVDAWLKQHITQLTGEPNVTNT
ncbi:hypothetical protein ACOBV9_22290 (plasmid) [Pseudoalteromonas espejiana]